MKLRVNGDERAVGAGTTVAGLLAELGFNGLVAVEVNGEVVRRKDHPDHALADGDVIEIVHFVGGG